MNIEKALKIELNSVSGLSNKVFPLKAPQELSGHYCIYDMTNTNRMMTIQSFDGLVEAEFAIAVYHTTYSAAKELMDIVITKVKSFLFRELATTGPYCQNVKILNEIETYDDSSGKFMVQIDIQISYKEE